MGTGACVLLLPYSLFRWGSGREAVIGSVLVFAKLGLSALPGMAGSGNAGLGFAVVVAAMALGAVFRFRAAMRMREFDQVKLAERERLARDLHDTVAHHVSAIAIRAQAGLAAAATRPDALTEALRVIEAEASLTLTEMRGMVRVLRSDDPAALAPGSSIADLEQLAGRDRGRPGPAVDLQISGDLAGVPPAVGAAIYRLVQESVTNARRHARHATRIEVSVTADDTRVCLRVSDDGDTGLLRRVGSPGYGLVGMIERARLLGGTCEAGPDPGRGWTVTATLPRTGTVT
jgi:signal transduction histidine kinase